MSSTKAGDTRLLDKILGVDPRPYEEDDDTTVVLPREAGAPEDPTPPPVTDPTPSSLDLPLTEPAEVAPGVVVDSRYRVQRLIGRGGIGLVYLCHHEVLEKPVAMKVLRPGYSDQPEVIERFVNEARAASAVKSQHIVNTLDVGSLPSGAPYFIMEYVEADTLAAVLQREGALTISEALEVARQMADGLGAAHGAGIVHRDLKPENVFLGRPAPGVVAVKIFDFGVAKLSRAKSRLTHVGAVFGTPSYMSPEQARGQTVDARADVYAIGVMLYEMVAGHLPFDGDDPLAVMAQHVDSEVPPLRQTHRGAPVPPALEAVVRRCLQKQREDRYPSVLELARDLEQVVAHPDAPLEHLRDSMLPEIVVPLDDVSSPAASDPFGSAPRLALPPVTVPLSGPHASAPRASAPQAAFPTVAAALPSAPVTPTAGVTVGPAAFPAAPAAQRRRSLVPLLALGLAATGALAWFTLPHGPAEGEPRAARSDVAAPPALPSARRPAPREREVHLVLSPLDAQVFVGEQNLGPMPVSVKVQEGKAVTVSVRRKGYRSRKLQLDGSQTRVVVGLNKLK